MTGRPTTAFFTTEARFGLQSEQAAQRLYARAASSPWTDLKRRLRHHPVDLDVLEGTAGWSGNIDAALPAVRSIPLAQIVGSVERARSQDFDAEFHPRNPRLKERWLSVAARRQAGRWLPPVELIEVDERYYVVDGHHRVSVERALGLDTIQARVTRVGGRQGL